MARGSDNIDYIIEGTFKSKLPKLYQLVIDEGLRHGIDIHNFDFVSCKNCFDIIDITYTNGTHDFDVSTKGSAKYGYRVLYSGISETLPEDDY